ncbi:MAG: cytochrome c biogenesis protein CcsA, partial [Gemmatimonadales bacterium]
VGVLFCTLVLLTGPLWAKPAWGTWWTWDARLTSTLFIFLLFIGYLVLRGAVSDPMVRAQYAAVLGILGMLLVPFIHITVYLFRTLHPDPMIVKPSAPSMPNVMLTTFLSSVVTYLVLYLGFVLLRYGLGVMREARLREEANAT